MKNKTDISPIFITGSVRSGTTVINRALVRDLGINGYDEGVFMDFLGFFLKVIDKKYLKQSKVHTKNADIILKDVPQEDFKKSCINWFLNEYLKYIKYEGVFVDKTPNIEFLYAVETICKEIPKAKFIITKRRPIDNLESRLIKFPGITFEQHCIFWKEIMEEIDLIIKKIPANRFLVVDQYDISKNPAKTAEEIGLFLNLSFEQIQIIKHTFMNTRPESTGGNEDEIKSLEETSWTKEQKEFFLETCGPISEKFGWSLDKKYYKN